LHHEHVFGGILEIMKIEMDDFTLALFIFWLLGSLLIIGIPATFAAQLNDKVSLYRQHKHHRELG